MHAIAPPYSRASDRQLGTNLDSKKKRKKRRDIIYTNIMAPNTNRPPIFVAYNLAF